MVRECLVCSKIKRASSGGDGDDAVWQSAAPLAPPVPHDDASLLTRCPECGAVYRYERSTERDITYETVAVSLRRLSFLEATRELPEPARSALAAERASREAGWREALIHPSEWVRRDAAWNLAALARSEGRWDEVASLLAHPDDAVREETVTGLAPDDASVPGSFEPVLIRLMKDPRAFTRATAARIVTARRLARGEATAVIDEVARDSDAARVTAIVHQLRTGAVPELLAESVRLLPLLHRDGDVRQAAVFLFMDALAENPPPSLMEGLLALLRGDDVAAAATALQALSRLRTASAALVELMPRWVKSDETEFRSLVVLEAQARLGADLTALLPNLSDTLAKNSRSRPGETVKVLQAMLPHASDKIPVLRALLRGASGSWSATIGSELDQVSRSGADLRALEPELRALQSGPDIYFVSSAVRDALARMN
jgi:hypothetical protein